MPAKKDNKASAKTVNKQKQKIIEDKTFGLKNKNKSKAVQKYVHSVTQNVQQAGSKEQRQKELEQEKRRQEKEAKRAKEAEMKMLFRDVDEKKKKEDVSASAAAAAERGEYLWTAEDFEPVEVDESRLEEQLEAERAALAERTDLTPVNEETFQKWWAAKKKRQAEEAEKQKKRQIKAFKQTGKGITGRALFEHDASLFVDDADAIDEIEREEDAEVEDAGLFDGEDLPSDEEA